MNQLIFTDAQIVTENDTFLGSIIIENDLIIDLIPNNKFKQAVSLNGMFMLPGLVDVHSDYFEKEINPRPNTGFPIDMALRNLDLRALSCGITSLFNAVSYREDEGTNRSIKLGLSMSKKMIEYHNKKLFKINHYLHARLDTTSISILDCINKILNYELTRVAVYNDHTPGQRQFRRIDKYLEYSSDRSGKSHGELLSTISKKQELAEKTKFIRPKLAEILTKNNLIIGSHDDTDFNHIDEAIKDGATFCEFPTTIDACRYAKEKRLKVLMGATNLILGKSQSGNISTRDVLKEGLVDALCSDYHLPSMIEAVIYLINNNIPIHEAVKMVSLNPAQIGGIDKFTGSIKIGKKADLLILNIIKNQPYIEGILVNGEIKYLINKSFINKELITC